MVGPALLEKTGEICEWLHKELMRMTRIKRTRKSQRIRRIREVRKIRCFKEIDKNKSKSYQVRHAFLRSV